MKSNSRAAVASGARPASTRSTSIHSMAPASVEMNGRPCVMHWRLSASASGKIDDGSTGSIR
ncbi:Uncharacterised protein [Bordetella pertussis]|nr:Uncharacterised protein [Bordetella pertussis]